MEINIVFLWEWGKRSGMQFTVLIDSSKADLLFLYFSFPKKLSFRDKIFNLVTYFNLSKNKFLHILCGGGTGLE